MSNQDTVRPYGHALYLKFAGTGESCSASTLQLDQGITVAKDGLSIVGRYHAGSKDFVIERFASETLASNAMVLVDAAIDRFSKRQRLIGAGKGFVRWCFAPAIAALFAAALNAAVTRSTQPSAMAAGLPPYPAVGQLAAPPGPVQAAAAPTQPAAADVAKGMSDAVKAGRLTVQVSTGSKGTMYVFSDPSCPHCRDFERELDALAKSYTIHILPVSVVGGTLSSGRIAHTLCQAPGARPAAWKKLMTNASTSSEAHCPEGTAAGAANDRIFRALGLPGTPSVVAADGRIMPETTSLQAASIDAWMQTSAR